MHLLNAARLADDLGHDRLTERQKAGYFMAATALTGLLGRGAGAGWSAAIVLHTAVSLAGIWCCFTANERGDGRAFLERILCLTLPLSVWWIIVVWAVAIAARLAAIGMGVPGPRYERWYGSFATWAYAVLLPLYYLAMGRYVARAAAAGADGR